MPDEEETKRLARSLLENEAPVEAQGGGADKENNDEEPLARPSRKSSAWNPLKRCTNESSETK